MTQEELDCIKVGDKMYFPIDIGLSIPCKVSQILQYDVWTWIGLVSPIPIGEHGRFPSIKLVKVGGVWIEESEVGNG